MNEFDLNDLKLMYICGWVVGFDWKALKEDSLVVDIGGGVGSASMLLNKAHPHLKFAVLDRPAVIPDGENVSERKLFTAFFFTLIPL